MVAGDSAGNTKGSGDISRPEYGRTCADCAHRHRACGTISTGLCTNLMAGMQVFESIVRVALRTGHPGGSASDGCCSRVTDFRGVFRM
jgi:hypothetical protein